ncbi:MAG: amino acid ABC transporter permease [Desulfobacterales bacterium]|nr:amino acid ABC transporter permease [Desulfobacterales bacterium]
MNEYHVIFNFLGTGLLEVLYLIPVCILLSLVLGAGIGIFQTLKIPGIYQAVYCYLVFMRGVPPLLFLLMVFFVAGFDSARICAVLTLSLYHAAYVAEIFRGGIQALPKGQFDAADSIALRFHQKMIHVIIPQVWRTILPALTGQYIILIKDTALVSAIGVMEILYNARQAMQVVYKPLLIYFLVALLFYCLCFSLECLSSYFEKRFMTE